MLITDKNLNVLLDKLHNAAAYHYIENVFSPLSPKDWANMLYEGETWNENASFILDGVLNGFKSIELLPSTTPNASSNLDKMNKIMCSIRK